MGAGAILISSSSGFGLYSDILHDSYNKDPTRVAVMVVQGRRLEPTLFSMISKVLQSS